MGTDSVVCLTGKKNKKKKGEAKPDSKNIKGIGAGVRVGVCKGPKLPAPAWPV